LASIKDVITLTEDELKKDKISPARIKVLNRRKERLEAKLKGEDLSKFFGRGGHKTKKNKDVPISMEKTRKRKLENQSSSRESKRSRIDENSVSPTDVVHLDSDLSKLVAAKDLTNSNFNKINSTQALSHDSSRVVDDRGETDDMFLVDDDSSPKPMFALVAQPGRNFGSQQINRVGALLESQNERNNMSAPSIRSTRQNQFFKPSRPSDYPLTNDLDPVDGGEYDMSSFF
jgi:hypothetical protein